jgi:hypothetical protein
VSLSDGGHFDNLGLYELVRRRCRFIIACDAEQDAGYTFGGLGTAIRKCRIDFGAEIDIDTSQIAVDAETARSAAHCTMGSIRYVDGTSGQLLYIKASLTGNEPEDLLEYAARHREFPHETTADQWFTETQFESYRTLGYHAANAALEPARHWDSRPSHQYEEREVASLFMRLGDHWAAVNPALRPHAIKHTQTLNKMMDTLRESPALWRLAAELFPGSPASSALLSTPEADFYFCMTLIQLVEDVYFDFNLDDSKWRGDPRIHGWHTLFVRWKNAPTMQRVWASQRDTYRKDFQVFWEALKN